MSLTVLVFFNDSPGSKELKYSAVMPLFFRVASLNKLDEETSLNVSLVMPAPSA
jgi:hypothetical protein